MSSLIGFGDLNQLLSNRYGDGIDDFRATRATIHKDGGLLLRVYNPLPNRIEWHGEIRFFYKNKDVGCVCRAFDSRDDAVKWIAEQSDKYTASFDPAKRQSSDDLDWYSR